MSVKEQDFLSLNRPGNAEVRHGRGVPFVLPALLDSMLFGDRRILRVEPGQDTFSIGLFKSEFGGKARRKTELEASRAAPRLWRNLGKKLPVVLVLPPEQVLTKEVELPEGAAKALQKAIEFNLPQWTPFQREEVHVAGRLIERNGERNRAELRLVPKPVVEQYAEQVQALGLKLDAIAIRPGSADLVWLDDRKLRKRKLGRLFDFGLLLMACGFLAAIATTQYQDRVGEVEHLKAELRAEISRHKEADQLTRKLTHLRERRDFLSDQISRRGDFMAPFNFAIGTIPAEVQIEEVVWSPEQLRLVLAAPPRNGDAAGADPWDPWPLAMTEFRSIGASGEGWPLREWIIPADEWGAR